MFTRILNRDVPMLVAIGLFAIAAITTGIGTSEKMKNMLLQQDALEAAQSWTTFLERKHDLSTTATADSGKSAQNPVPHPESTVKYRIYDSRGELLHDSDETQERTATQRRKAKLEPSSWAKLLGGRSYVRILRGQTEGAKQTYADVFLPVLTGGQAGHVLEVSINQTRKAERFDRVFKISAIVTVALLAVGIGIPGGLFWHHAHARRKIEREVDFLAHNDSLTGLANYKSFEAKLTAILSSADLGVHTVAVLSIGIDRFKHVNDSLGHAVGDALLQEMAARCRAYTRETDVVGRMTGDEFGVIAPGFRSNDELAAFATDLRALLMEPLDIQGHYLCPSVSIGISVAPDDSKRSAMLIKNATTSQNWAKQEDSKRVRFFHEDMDQAVKASLTLEMDMRRALDLDQFFLVYQPQFNLQTGELVGCEALVRWEHPDLGTISPDRFIPLAEKLGTITELGERILQTACREAVSWPKPISVAVNLSPAQFTGHALATMVSNVMETTTLPADRLEVEITEGLIINDTDEALSLLHRLRKLGVSIAMDDFGTGYSSLSYLTRFPYTKLKIDRSLLWRIEDDANVASVIDSIVRLGRSLKMKVIVEGVETEAQAQILRNSGCELVQGFLFAKPMSEPDLVARLHAESAERAEKTSTAA